MNLHPQAIQQAIKVVKANTGIDVEYRSGMWFYSGGNDVWQPYDAAGQQSLNELADRQVGPWLTQPAPPATPAASPTSSPLASQPAAAPARPRGTNGQFLPSGSTPGPASPQGPMPPGPSGGGGRFGAAASAITPAFQSTRSATAATYGVATALGAAALGGMYSARNSAQDAASGVLEGASDVVQSALGVGKAIGKSLLDGALSAFGQSGAAIAGVISAVMDSASSIVGAGAKAVGRGVQGVASVAGAGLGVAGAAAGAAMAIPLAFAVGPMALLAGAAIGGAIVAGIMKAVSGLAHMVSAAFEAVSQVIGELGKAAGVAVQAAIDILQDVTRTAMDQSKAILDLSQRTGLSIAQASRAVTTAGAFGIDPSKVQPQNPILGQIQGQMYGGDGTGSREDISAFRTWYRDMAKSPMGVMVAQSMTPEDKKPYIAAANLPDAMFNRQLDRSETMGMNPEAVLETQQNLKGLMDTFGQLVTTIKTSLLEALLPALTEGLDAAIGYWVENKEKIIEVLWSIGRFVYADLPVMVLTGLKRMAEMAMEFGHTVVGAVRWVGGMLSDVGAMFTAFHEGRESWLDNVSSILAGIDAVSGAFHFVQGVFAEFGVVIYNVFAFLYNRVVGMMNGMVTAVTSLPVKVMRFFGLDKESDEIAKVRYAPLPYQALGEATASAASMASDYSGSFEKYRKDSAGDTGKSFTDAGARLSARADKADAAIDKYGNRAVGALERGLVALGPSDVRGKAFDDKRHEGLLKQIADNTGKTADATKSTADNMIGFAQGIIVRTASYIAEDATANLMRAS